MITISSIIYLIISQIAFVLMRIPPPRGRSATESHAEPAISSITSIPNRTTGITTLRKKVSGTLRRNRSASPPASPKEYSQSRHATNTTPSINEGVLQLKSKNGKWKKRWIQLDSRNLYCRKSPHVSFQFHFIEMILNWFHRMSNRILR